VVSSSFFFLPRLPIQLPDFGIYESHSRTASF
jgi:hypothetical protein